jgi:hypothetical protein
VEDHELRARSEDQGGGGQADERWTRLAAAVAPTTKPIGASISVIGVMSRTPARNALGAMLGPRFLMR